MNYLRTCKASQLLLYGLNYCSTGCLFVAYSRLGVEGAPCNGTGLFKGRVLGGGGLQTGFPTESHDTHEVVVVLAAVLGGLGVDVLLLYVQLVVVAVVAVAALRRTRDLEGCCKVPLPFSASEGNPSKCKMPFRLLLFSSRGLSSKSFSQPRETVLNATQKVELMQKGFWTIMKRSRTTEQSTEEKDKKDRRVKTSTKKEDTLSRAERLSRWLENPDNLGRLQIVLMVNTLLLSVMYWWFQVSESIGRFRVSINPISTDE